MIGGPPCQGFSVMGRQAVADPRNDLFGKFFELVSECLPKFFVAENVSNIMTPKYESIRDAAFSHVEARYTLLPPMRIKASDYGGATIRERVFFIGFLRDEIKPATSEEFQARRKPGVTVKRALAGLPTDIDDQWLTEVQSWQRLGEIEPCDYIKNAVQSLVEGVGASEAISRLSGKREVSGCFGTRHSEPVRQRYGDLRPKQKDDISKAVRLDWEGFCPTLRAGTAADKGSYQAVRPIHPSQARVITPREAARLQGFPDWFQFAPSKWHSFRQIGNSVCPLVGEAVFQVIAKRL